MLAPTLLLKPHASSQTAFLVHFENAHECVTFALSNLGTGESREICWLKCSPLKGSRWGSISCCNKCHFSFYFLLLKLGGREGSQLQFIHSCLTLLSFPHRNHHCLTYLCSWGGKPPEGRKLLDKLLVTMIHQCLEKWLLWSRFSEIIT